MSKGPVEDPAFASAVEAAYLTGLRLAPSRAEEPIGKQHTQLLEQAIYKADPTNGGLRFKNLANAPELDQRLLRVLSQRSND